MQRVELAKDPNILNLVLEVILEQRSYTLDISVAKTRNLSILLTTANIVGDPKDYYIFIKGVRY